MIFACLSLAVLLAACGGGNAPTQQPTGADSTTSRAGEPTTPVPTPHYTTTPATGAFAHLVPKGYEIVKAEAGEVITMGDLDGDTKPDAAILLQNMDEEMGKAAILIAYQQAENTFSLGEMTGDLGPEPLMSPDPSLLKIDKGVLTFHYQSMRWSIDLKFRKEAKYGDLRLIGSESENYGNAVHDGAGSASTNYLTGQRISNYMSWDEAKQDLVDLPEKREQVSKELRPLKGFNQDLIYDDL